MTQILLAECFALTSSAGLMYVALAGFPRKRTLTELEELG